MIVLGIHDGHTSSACLMVDGRLVALVAEERFTRLKSDHGYPRHAIDYCLREGGIAPDDLDHVAFASTNMNIFAVGLKAIARFDNSDWIGLHNDYWKPRLYDGVEHPEAFERVWADRFDDDVEHYYDFSMVDGSHQSLMRDKALACTIRLDGVKRHLGLGDNKIGFYDHHACHAYYALFGGPLRADNTLVFTLDGGGDGSVSTLWRFTGGRMQELARSNAVDTARIYRETTLLLGMKLGEHEYKLMGLAPYAPQREENKSYAIFDGMFTVTDDMIAYADCRRPADLYFWFRDAYEGHRFDGIAAAVQRMVEVSVSRWVERSLAKYDSRAAAFAGGVAMNVKLNQLLADADWLDAFHVCPSPTDDTLCAGACYMAELERDPSAWQTLRPIETPYLGPAFDGAAVRRAVADSAIAADCVIEEGAGPERVAELLADGHVVARASGRMEFGARALGNRSLLADPRSEATVEKINRQIKYRDFWMPFAPVVKAERAQDYFAYRRSELCRRHMMIAADTTALGRAELPAAIHRGDRTARPQVVERDFNPAYHETISVFERRTGTGALLNTSFNLHGEPIVCSPVDAISTFQRSEIDALSMADVIVRRRGEA